MGPKDAIIRPGTDDPEAVKQQYLEFDRRERERVRWLGRTLDLYEGRAYLWHVLGLCRLNSTSYNGDVHDMLYNEGQRKIGLEIQNEVLTHYPRAYNLMRSEAIKRETERNEDNG